MVEVYFEELGVFTGKEIESIKKALEGASYMEFQITSYCQYGNYTLGVRTFNKNVESKEELRNMFLHCALSAVNENVAK